LRALQALDGVPRQYLLDLNAGIRMPDLAVVLSAAPLSIATRIAARGATHRFNRAPDFPAR
jgi:dTMP kinase